ncbi:MAG: hypothetical protein J6I74_03660 [Schwartzia sp.]|nr:hypothetical protein [Schwartzia sp. (in: firmicutes)]
MGLLFFLGLDFPFVFFGVSSSFEESFFAASGLSSAFDGFSAITVISFPFVPFFCFDAFFFLFSSISFSSLDVFPFAEVPDVFTPFTLSAFFFFSSVFFSVFFASCFCLASFFSSLFVLETAAFRGVLAFLSSFNSSLTLEEPFNVFDVCFFAAFSCCAAFSFLLFDATVSFCVADFNAPAFACFVVASSLVETSFFTEPFFFSSFDVSEGFCRDIAAFLAGEFFVFADFSCFETGTVVFADFDFFSVIFFSTASCTAPVLRFFCSLVCALLADGFAFFSSFAVFTVFFAAMTCRPLSGISFVVVLLFHPAHSFVSSVLICWFSSSILCFIR